MKELIEKATLQILKRLPGALLTKLAGGESICIDGRTLDPVMQLLWVQGKKQPPMESLTPEQARDALSAAVRLLDGKAVGMSKTENTTIPGPGGPIPVRIYHPHTAPSPSPLLLYFHQGGCVIGDLETCDTFCTILADVARCRVMSIDYRLAPEHTFPAAVDDALAVYRWAIQNSATLDSAPDRLVVAGDSAGGQLAAVITHEMKREGGQLPMYQVLIYPWLMALADTPSYTSCAEAYPLSKSLMEWFGGHYLNDEAEVADARVSPLLEPDFSGLPPALIVTAGFDPLRDEGKAYADKLEQAGVPVTYRCMDGLTHSFTAFSGAVPAAKEAVEEIAVHLRDALE